MIGRWVPDQLTCKSINVVNEKWVYMNDSQNANNLHKWVPLDGSGDQLRPMAPRINNMTKKFHIVVVSNINGNSYFEVLHDGVSINSERYIRFYENAFDSLKLTNIQRHSIQWMHDNAPPHRSQQTKVFYSHLESDYSSNLLIHPNMICMIGLHFVILKVFVEKSTFPTQNN